MQKLILCVLVATTMAYHHNHHREGVVHQFAERADDDQKDTGSKPIPKDKDLNSNTSPSAAGFLHSRN